MSHQFNEFWFPQCIICGCGNLLGIVCLSHFCHENHRLIYIEKNNCIEFNKDNHAWKKCQFCDSILLADAASWGSYALCRDCWNLYVKVGRYPPTTISEIIEEIKDGKLEIGWDPDTKTSIRVK